MILELNAEQEQILEMAIKSGMSREEVLTQAFAIIRCAEPRRWGLRMDRQRWSAEATRQSHNSVDGWLLPPSDLWAYFSSTFLTFLQGWLSTGATGGVRWPRQREVNVFGYG